MRTRDAIEVLATIILVGCAVLIAVVVTRREFATSGKTIPTFREEIVGDWERYAIGGEWMTPSSAPDTIVVFSDFQCPYCKRLDRTLSRVQHRREPTLVAILHRNFPLTRIHPNAWAAAIAAECAANRGQFPAYHDLLFAKQDSLDHLDWTLVAGMVGIEDTSAFRSCLSDESIAARIRADSTAAEALGIEGTPLVLVNGVLYQGTLDEVAIEQALRRGHNN